MRLPVYRNGGKAFTLDGKEPFRKIQSAKHKAAVMADDTITVTVDASSSLPFMLRDYLLYEGRPYFLNVWPEVKKIDKGLFRHTAKFEGGMFELGRVLFTLSGLNGWDYYGTLYDMCILLLKEMNRSCFAIKGNTSGGQRIFHYKGMQGAMYWWKSDDGSYDFLTYEEFPTAQSTAYSPVEPIIILESFGRWTLDFENETVGGSLVPIDTDVKQMTYESHSCLAVLQDLCSTWEGWEFAVVTNQQYLYTDNSRTVCGGCIVLRRKQTGFRAEDGIDISQHSLSFGKSGGLSEITRKPSDDGNLPSRIYFYGGTANVPVSYRCSRICLPYVCKDMSFMNLTGGQSANPNNRCEVVKVFDEIHPANKPFAIMDNGELPHGDIDRNFVVKVPKTDFFDLFAKWKDPSDTTSQYGTFAEWMQTYGTGDYSTDLERYLLYYYQGDLNTMQPGFPKSCYLTSNEGVTVTFQTGELAGYAFKISEFYTRPDTYYELLLIRQGMESIYGDVIEKIPNAAMMCHAGDKFVIEGCLMPPMYTYYQGEGDSFSAEGQLLDAATDYLLRLGDNITFDVKPAGDYVISSMKANPYFAFRIFDSLQINDGDVAYGYQSPFRIEEAERNLVDEVNYTLKLGVSMGGRGANGKGNTGTGASKLKEALRILLKPTENVRPVVKSPAVSRGVATGQRIYLNGVDVTDSQEISIIDATSQWFGSQAAYNELVASGQVQTGVAYHVMPQADWEEEDPNSLAFIRNKPDIMDVRCIQGSGNKYNAEFYYK